MSIRRLRGAVEWPLLAALALGAGAIALAQEEEQPDGRVVQIGQADDAESRPALPPPDGRGAKAAQPDFAEQQQEVPAYWIGLLGGEIDADHVLRAHVDLPHGQGLLVASVVPDSPAAKAGLKRHDILLRANDAELRTMRDLVELVRTEGEKQGQITLEILRHGERATIYLTPEERPADAPGPQGRPGGGGFGGGLQFPEGLPNELFDELERRGLPFDFRNFGPGVIVGGGRGLAGMPNGVTISVQKQDGQPARITVKRGDETWEVVGDDEESLQQLPEDLRPFVEQMLHGGSPLGMDFQMPNLEGLGRPGAGDERLLERLQKMEERMAELQRRLLDSTVPQPEKSNEADEAK